MERVRVTACEQQHRLEHVKERSEVGWGEVYAFVSQGGWVLRDRRRTWLTEGLGEAMLDFGGDCATLPPCCGSSTWRGNAPLPLPVGDSVGMACTRTAASLGTCSLATGRSVGWTPACVAGPAAAPPPTGWQPAAAALAAAAVGEVGVRGAMRCTGEKRSGWRLPAVAWCTTALGGGCTMVMTGLEAAWRAFQERWKTRLEGDDAGERATAPPLAAPLCSAAAEAWR